jgi:hypothetical protein
MTYGTINADVIGTSVANTSLGAGNASTLKNRIINGAMVISQYNGTAFNITANDGYCIDRWKYNSTQNGKGSLQQISTSGNAASAGFSNALAFTSNSAYSVVTGDSIAFLQNIEGFNSSDLQFGTSSAKTITLSAWVYSSLTGTFGGAISNSAVNRSYPFSYTISSANTWTQISITIAGDTSGTWIGATNGIGLRVFFSIGAGATFSGTAGTWASADYRSCTGATSVVGTNGATFYITGVQLEVGSSATGYEYRQYGQELALCQRYFQSTFPIGIAPQQNYGSVYELYAVCTQGSATGTKFVVPMRATPSTITTYNPFASNASFRQANSSTDVSVVPSQATSTGVSAWGGSFSPTIALHGNWSATAEL